MLDSLLTGSYKVILRPHPQYIRHCNDRLKQIEEKYGENGDFILQMDFSSNATVFNADVLITDWSGIAYEYSFVTLKPTLFIDTPMKIMNPDYQEIDVVPFDIEIRNKIGISISVNNVNQASETVDKLLSDNSFSKGSMLDIRNKYLYNVGTSAEVGAKYIINRLIEYSKR